MKVVKGISFEQAVRIHDYLIERYGGAVGVRDKGALESSLQAPLATFGGEYLHESIHEIAAAYFFYLIKNHPFLDGNKRTATHVTMTFLDGNNSPDCMTNDQWVDLAVAVAKNDLDKDELTAFFKKNA